MAIMVLYGIDECGCEFFIKKWDISVELDEDALYWWQCAKIEKARARYPEARSFHFEDRRYWTRAINYLTCDDSLSMEEAIYLASHEDDDERW